MGATLQAWGSAVQMVGLTLARAKAWAREQVSGLGPTRLANCHLVNKGADQALIAHWAPPPSVGGMEAGGFSHLILGWGSLYQSESQAWEEGTRQGANKQRRESSSPQLACRTFLSIFPSRALWHFMGPWSEAWLRRNGGGPA